MTVWAEGVFFLNAALDYLLLAGAVRLQGERPTKRLIPAALMGGLLAMLALLPIRLFRGLCGSVIGLFLLTGCAYGFSMKAMRCGAMLLGLSLALCGIQTAVSDLFGVGYVIRRDGVLLMTSWQSLVASAAMTYGLCAAFSGAIHGRKRLFLPVQVTAAGKTLRFRCLSDTGSFLRDPLTGRPVVLADCFIAESLLGINPEQLRIPTVLLERLLRDKPELYPRLIPYSAVGTEHGMLLGIRCTQITVGNQKQDGGILAFSPGNVSEDGSYHGLTGG